MAQNNQQNAPIREETPEPFIIPSQHRLQQVIDAKDPMYNIPEHVLEYYKSRGLILVSDEGNVILATPKIKARKN